MRCAMCDVRCAMCDVRCAMCDCTRTLALCQDLSLVSELYAWNLEEYSTKITLHVFSRRGMKNFVTALTAEENPDAFLRQSWPVQ